MHWWTLCRGRKEPQTAAERLDSLNRGRAKEDKKMTVEGKGKECARVMDIGKTTEETMVMKSKTVGQNPKPLEEAMVALHNEQDFVSQS